MQINTRSKTPLKLTVTEMQLLSNAVSLLDHIDPAAQMVGWNNSAEKCGLAAKAIEAAVKALAVDANVNKEGEPAGNQA